MEATNKMEETNKTESRRGLWLMPLCVAGAALVVFALTLANYVYPGESAHLYAQWAGLDALDFPAHPVWAFMAKLFAAQSWLGSIALRLNVLSLLSGVLSAGLIAFLVAYFVRRSTSGEDTAPFAASAALVAGVVAGGVFVFSTAIWQSASHLEYRMFDVAFALVALSLFTWMSRCDGRQWIVAAVIGALFALGILESAIFVGLLPLAVLFVVVVCVKKEKSPYLAVSSFLVALLLAYVVCAYMASSSFLDRPEAASTEYESALAVMLDGIGRISHEIRMWFSRPGWLFVQLLAVLPFVACGFAAVRGLNNERTWSQYLFHFAMTICAILAVATPLSPESLLRKFGLSPVATSALVAAYCGYLAAYWYVLARTPLHAPDGTDKLPLEQTFGRQVAPGVMVALLAILVLGSLVNAFSCKRDRGAFADRCAAEILDRLDGRTWFVTDGTLDDHLRILAATRGQELNLVCLQRDMNDAYLKEFAQLVKEKGLSGGKADLSLSIQLGVLPFIQDWFNGDHDVIKKAAIFGVPDFWYMAEKVPVPNGLFFNGVVKAKDVDGAALKADFDKFWKDFGEVLGIEGKLGSRSIRKIEDQVDALKMRLRRHVGFLANNLGVLLQDLDRDDDAFAVYEMVLNDIDPDNVCALFNEFEMARKGVKVAVAHKQGIERKIKAIVDDPKRRYLLWSLSRYYGYIRSPEIFARMGYTWARSGQTGNAIAQVQRAIDFVPADRQTGLLNMMAAIYASGNDAKKSRAVYEKVLASDANNHDALLGLTRLALQEGSLVDARAYLEKAVKAAGDKPAAGFEWALLHMMNNDLNAARLALQKVTDTHPKSLQAWSLLAGVVLQQVDGEKDEKVKAKAMEELETIILPRMESIADSPRNYFVQITRALILMRKGSSFRKSARDALVAASMSRPDVSVTGDMILNLDIQMNDGESAERHARQVLRRDRHNKLANYVMGSLRLKEGDYSSAETFLRLSVEAERPVAAAQNDLAEVLRRLQRYEEAEKFARDAVKTAPELYVAWETLGSALLDQNKNLDEAETCVKKAIDLAKTKASIEDIRMQITLARVQIAKGDLPRARGTLRTLRTRQSELSNYDRNELEKLIKSAKMK